MGRCGLEYTQGKEEQLGAPEPTQPKINLWGKTILVVEDESQVRTLLAKLLEKFGATVWSTVDGLAALELLQRQTPDLILCDVMMPRLDGFVLAKALKWLKENRGWSPYILIFLTAKTDARTMIDAMNLGARRYIPKPFQIADVLDKIDRALRDGRRK